MTDNEIIARWLGYKFKDGEWLTQDGKYAFNPTVIGNVEFWHGKGRLLEKIEEKGLERKFYLHWVLNGGLTGNPKFSDAWLFRRAEPAQLTDALVATIKEVSDGSV